MKQINEITQDPYQEHLLIGEEGEQINLVMRYSDNQEGWIANITFGDTVINGIKLVSSVNILHSWRNIFPFGLAIACTDKGDPYYIDDFINSRAQMFLLNNEEKEEFELIYYGQ